MFRRFLVAFAAGNDHKETSLQARNEGGRQGQGATEDEESGGTLSVGLEPVGSGTELEPSAQEDSAATEASSGTRSTILRVGFIRR